MHLLCFATFDCVTESGNKTDEFAKVDSEDWALCVLRPSLVGPESIGIAGRDLRGAVHLWRGFLAAFSTDCFTDSHSAESAV